MKPGVHGSILLHIKDGIVTGVKFHEDFNIPSFVEHVEKPVSRAVVRIKAVKEEQKVDVNLVKDEQSNTNLQEVTNNDMINTPENKGKV